MAIYGSETVNIHYLILWNCQTTLEKGLYSYSTKQWFNQYSVLTIHSIIANNTLNFVHKTKNCSSVLPLSVKNTISDSIILMSMIDQSDPVFLSWLAEFNTHVYRKSIFFKGPLLYFDPSTVQKYATLASCISFKIFKSKSKRSLFGLQSEGDRSWRWLENKHFFDIRHQMHKNISTRW